MKTIISLNNVSKPFIIDIDETLKGSISLESLHMILSQAFLDMEQSSLSEQFKDIKNGSVGAIAIKTAYGSYVGKILISVDDTVVTYDIETVTSDIDITITPAVNKAIIGYITPVLFDISSVGNKNLDIKIVMTADEIDIAFANEFIANISPIPPIILPPPVSKEQPNPYISGATSCEIYINGVFTDVFLPFDSNFYWFGTGTNYLSPYHANSGEPRFSLYFNENVYFTDKLTSDTCKLNSIIRLNTYDDYIIFK